METFSKNKATTPHFSGHYGQRTCKFIVPAPKCFAKKVICSSSTRIIKKSDPEEDTKTQ